MGIDVNFPDDVNVAELHDEIIAVLEAVAEIDADLVTIDDADDVAVCVCVLETCIEDVTVAV
jgi:septum formation topological specificity factor MinE